MNNVSGAGWARYALVSYLGNVMTRYLWDSHILMARVLSNAYLVTRVVIMVTRLET